MSDDSAASDSSPSVAAPKDPPESGPVPVSGRDQGELNADAGYRPSYTFLVVVTLVNVVADLWSKHWAKSTFEAIKPGHPRKVVVIEDLMNFIYAQNFGGAWGLLQKADESVRRPFFLAVSVAAIVFIVSLYRKLRPGQTALKWGLPLVLGGALGNLVDRVRYGFVVDFIDVYLTSGGRENHWPTFNIADVSICVGVVLMAVDMFTTRPSKSADKAKTDDAPSSEASPASSAPASESPASASPPSAAPPSEGEPAAESAAARDVAG